MNTLAIHDILLDPFTHEGDGIIHTTSHLRMWRLTMNGYHVVSTGLIPRSTVLGGTRYTRVWDLMPPKET